MLHKPPDYIQEKLLLIKFYGEVGVFRIFYRYHEKCLQLYKNPKEIKSAQRNDPD